MAEGGGDCEGETGAEVLVAVLGGGFRSFLRRLRGLIIRGRLFSDECPPELSSLATLKLSPGTDFPSLEAGEDGVLALAAIAGRWAGAERAPEGRWRNT